VLRAAPKSVGHLVKEVTSPQLRPAFLWLRRWASTVAAVGVISGLGILLAAITGLGIEPNAQAASQASGPGVEGPAPLAPYDPGRGAAPVVRLNTPAQTQLVAAQRRYALALDRQQWVEAGYQAQAGARHRALAETADAAQQAQTRIFADRQHQQVIAAARARLAETEAAGSGALPIAAGVIGTRFGATGSWASYHTGVDFRAPYGEPVHAAAAGTVVFAGNSGDWAGNHVAVQHPDGVTTMYSHLSWIGATVGQQVAAGQVLGRVGQTGRAFGPHLHFEVYPPGVRFGDVYRAVDPLPWLAAVGVHPR
jgi:murein DD-endopeptidase MepM/ murein hydrolase activator NlpD